MATTLSPVTATTFRVINIGSIQISHLAAKTCKLVKLRTERLQLSLVHTHCYPSAGRAAARSPP